MAEWADRIEGHPVASALRDVEALLVAAVQVQPPSADALASLERIRNALGVVRTSLESVDPDLIPVSALDSLATDLQGIAPQITSYIGDQSIGHLTATDPEIDSILVASAPLRIAATGEQSIVNVQQAVVNFRESAETAIRQFEEESGRLRTALQELRTEAEERDAEIRDQRSRLDQSIAQYQAQFSDAEANRVQTFQTSLTEARANLDSAISEGRQELTAIARTGEETIRELVEKSETDIAEAITAAETTIRTRLDETSAAAGKVMKDLDELKQQAIRVVTVIGNTGLTGDYQRTANVECKSADFWRYTAFGSFIAAAAGNAIVLGFELHQHVSLATLIAARVSISIPLLALAAYALAESTGHRRQERANRQMELQLASIGPYLADLPDTEQRKIRARVFDNFFPGRRSDSAAPAPAETSDPSS